MPRRTSAPTGLVHALLYRRISGSDRQKEGVSLETQQTTLRDYASRQNGWIIAGEYEDVMTGKRADRPAYQAMLAEARRLRTHGERVAIVVLRLDHLGRNKAEYFRSADELEKQGAEVHSVKDGGVLDETHAGILAVFAAKESRQIAARVKENVSTIVSKGWHWGPAPFGYTSRPPTAEEIAAGCRPSMHQLEPDPEQSAVLVQAFERVAAGEPIRRVARWMASLPARERGYRTWCASTLNHALQSPTYVARPVQGAENILDRPPTHWKPLVSDELWLRVQERMSRHARQPHQASGRFLLTGFIRCERCGSRASAITTHSGTWHGYRCSSWTLGASAPLPGCAHVVSMRRADDAVLDRVGRVLGALTRLAEAGPKLRQEWLRLSRPNHEADRRRLARLERTIEEAKHDLAEAARLLTRGTLDAAGYNALRDEQLQLLKSATAERERLTAHAASTGPDALPPLEAALEAAGAWGQVLGQVDDVPAQRDVLTSLIERVSVRRIPSRQYEAAISWTPLGARLAQLLETETRAA